MVNDKIIHVIFFVISLVIVSVVAHMDDTKSFASTEHRENTVDTQIGSENKTGTILFMLESPEGDADDKTNDGA